MTDATTLNLAISQIAPLITSLAALTAAIVGLMNRRSLGGIQKTVDGAQTIILDKSHKNAADAARAKGELVGRDFADAENERRNKTSNGGESNENPKEKEENQASTTEEIK